MKNNIINISVKIVVMSLFLMHSLLLQAQITSPFRFVQLTDLHVNAGSDGPSEDLLNCVDHINKLDSIDFVIVTGDITENGDKASLLEVKSILDKLKVKYFTIPGNHETKWSESGMTDFGAIFGGERFEFEHKGLLFLGFNTGPLMRMAYGHVVPQDIAWLKERLCQRGVSKPVVIATHYPVIEGDVDNWYEVTDAVRPYNIRTFVGGHYHVNRLSAYDGIPGILVRSSLRDKEGVSGYGLYEVTPDSMYVYDQPLVGEPTKWAAISMTHNYYDRGGKADKYPDFSINERYPDVVESWLVGSGIAIYSSAAVYKDRLFVGDDMGFMSCYLQRNGKKLWSFKSGHRIVGTPDVDGEVVVFGSADGKIYGIDANKGLELWQITTNAPVLGAVTIDDGVAYVGGSDNVFRAISISDGAVLWTYDNVEGYVETKPLVEGDKVIFGAWDSTLYALSKGDGRELWRWSEVKGTHFSPAAVWPVAADGKVFITDPQRAMTAIDIETGETVWRSFKSMVRETIGLSSDKKRIYSKTMRDSVVCYSALGDVAEQVWATNVGFGYEHAPSMQIECDGVMYGGTKEGLVFALDAMTGDLLWSHKVGNSLVNTPTPISRNKVIFTSSSGDVGLLEWEE